MLDAGESGVGRPYSVLMPTITALGVPHSALAPVWLLRQIMVAFFAGAGGGGGGAGVALGAGAT